jgi:hypothetical protein
VRPLVSNHSLEEREVRVANDIVRYMDAWTIILMLGATAIWTTMVIAVAWRIRLVRAEGLEPPRAVKPNGT